MYNHTLTLNGSFTMILRNRLLYFFAVAGALLAQPSFSQDFLDVTPLSLQADGLTKAKVITVLDQSYKDFSAVQMRELADKVKQYNATIDLQIQQTIESRQGLVDIRQRLLQQRDNVKLQQQLQEANSSYGEIIEDIKKNLETVAYKGFYICVFKNISPLSNPDDLIDRAKATITPIASEDVLGILIQSVTDWYRSEDASEEFYRYVRQEIKGKLEVEHKYKHHIDPAQKVFWYACKVVVTPLKDKSQVKTQQVAVKDADPNVVVVNVLKESDVAGALRQSAIPQSIVSDIQATVDANRMAVVSENGSIKSRENGILTSGQQKLNEQQEKIELIKRRIDQAHTSIRRLVENNTTVKYNPNNMAGSIDAANKVLLAKIKELIDQELYLREKKLQVEWDRSIATPGDPKEAISNNVMELKNQFETNYGKIEQFVEITELENDDLTVSQGRTVTYKRKVERMWIFLEPQSNGFKLHVAARFRIAGDANITTGQTAVAGTTTTSSGSTFSNFTERVAGVAIDMVAVKGGTYTMGCTSEQGSDCWDDEKPAHRVTVSDFYMGKYEVTNRQYCAFLNAKGNQIEGGVEWINLGGEWDDEKCRIYRSGSSYSVESGYDNHPVIYVSWYGARAYCQWLSAQTGKTYRLPTEAEWEYAARSGGKSYKYAWGNGTPTKSNGGNIADETAKRRYSDWTIWSGYTDGYVYTAPVGQFGVNDLGLADMTGNVWEWCSDWYGSYSSQAQTNPQGPSNGSNRVLRGGSWSSDARGCRVSRRYGSAPGNRGSDFGFRVVLSPVSSGSR